LLSRITPRAAWKPVWIAYFQSGWEVILVDNASKDDTVGRASRFASQVRIVRSSVNTGFAGGVNQGAAQASGDVLVLVNPDTVVAQGALDKMRAALSDPRVGGVLLLAGDRLLKGNVVRRFPTLGRLTGRASSFEQPLVPKSMESFLPVLGHGLQSSAAS
jgi:GT2 family glycosyltransferase